MHSSMCAALFALNKSESLPHWGIGVLQCGNGGRRTGGCRVGNPHLFIVQPAPHGHTVPLSYRNYHSVSSFYLWCNGLTGEAPPTLSSGGTDWFQKVVKYITHYLFPDFMIIFISLNLSNPYSLFSLAQL